jgi:hypothetical protein
MFQLQGLEGFYWVAHEFAAPFFERLPDVEHLIRSAAFWGRRLLSLGIQLG